MIAFASLCPSVFDSVRRMRMTNRQTGISSFDSDHAECTCIVEVMCSSKKVSFNVVDFGINQKARASSWWGRLRFGAGFSSSAFSSLAFSAPLS